jgi:hypothetical protein
MRPCISGFLGIGESYSRLPMEAPEVTVAGRLHLSRWNSGITVRPNHLGAALHATAVAASSKTAISAGTCRPESVVRLPGDRRFESTPLQRRISGELGLAGRPLPAHRPDTASARVPKVVVELRPTGLVVRWCSADRAAFLWLTS